MSLSLFFKDFWDNHISLNKVLYTFCLQSSVYVNISGEGVHSFHRIFKGVPAFKEVNNYFLDCDVADWQGHRVTSINTEEKILLNEGNKTLQVIFHQKIPRGKNTNSKTIINLLAQMLPVDEVTRLRWVCDFIFIFYLSIVWWYRRGLGQQLENILRTKTTKT